MVCSVQNYASALTNVKMESLWKNKLKSKMLTDDKCVDDDQDSEEEDMDIDDLENDYFLDQ